MLMLTTMVQFSPVAAWKASEICEAHPDAIKAALGVGVARSCASISTVYKVSSASGPVGS